MDISDISKVATRKRMNNDAEKLREKVSRETAKIIKLKVAQDTAYWDLKEKLQQVEANHERLQQNMVEVQMQHEAISGQYQEELRLRPDTLNKLSGTRHICDVLEEYGERLRRGVARARADQQALGAAYGECGARVRGLAARAGRVRELARERRLAQRRAEAGAQRLALTLERLGAVRARADACEAQRRELAERLERTQAELKRREDIVASLQADTARLLREYEARASDLRGALADRDEQMKEACARGSEALAARQAAEEREASALQQRDAARRRLQRVEGERAEAAATIDQLKMEVASLTDDKRQMETLIEAKNQCLATLEAELTLVKDRLSSAESSQLEAEAALRSARQEAEARAAAADELARRVTALERAATEAQADAAAQRAAGARHADELRASVAERERELDDKARTITRLMADLKAEAEARARSDAALSSARRQHDAERAELAGALSRLETASRAKDDEIGAQLAIILDMRKESERLQERVRAKQATIDNIQKELTGRAPPPAPAAERDAAPGRPARDCDVLYGFLSDGSVDGDALDAREVGRRFDALARSDLPLHAMRPQGTVSLSQVKKDLKMKSRTFFKNKRLESKMKKLKE